METIETVAAFLARVEAQKQANPHDKREPGEVAWNLLRDDIHTRWWLLAFSDADLDAIRASDDPQAALVAAAVKAGVLREG